MIDILEDPHEFLEVDEHTLVMAVFCPVKVPKIAADRMHPNTLAGVFVNGAYMANKASWYKEEGYGEFEFVFGQECSKSLAIDLYTPRVVKMLDDGIGCTFRGFGDEENVRWMNSMQLRLLKKEDVEPEKSVDEGTMRKLCGKASDCLEGVSVTNRTFYRDLCS
jgi:hypothetical protein